MADEMVPRTCGPRASRRPVVTRRRGPRTDEPHDRLSIWLPTRAIDQLITTATKHRISVSQLVRIVVLQVTPPDGD